MSSSREILEFLGLVMHVKNHALCGATAVVPWLSYSSLDPRFAGSKPARVNGFFLERKNPEYAFLRKGCKAVDPVS